jgi:hypothetical protein
MAEQYIVCTQTGTILHLKHCVILNEDDLTQDEWEEGDLAVSAMAKERGVGILYAIDAAKSVIVSTVQGKIRRFIDTLPQQVLFD